MVIASFDEFYAEGMVAEVLTRLKSGKEATVYLCRAGGALDLELVAAKIFHGRVGRGFQNRAAYQSGRVFGGTRLDRAVMTKSRLGRAVAETSWVNREFDVLCGLHAAGADVPRPLAATDDAILMEYVGGEDDPAPRLREIRPDVVLARRLFEQLLWNIELFLANNVVHGDLSPYNILFDGGKAMVIDFPQAVDPRVNTNADVFLTRDVECLCRYFDRFGVRADAAQLSGRLWHRYASASMQVGRGGARVTGSGREDHHPSRSVNRSIAKRGCV